MNAMDLSQKKNKPTKPYLHKSEDEKELVPVQNVYDQVELPQASLEEEAELFISRHRGLTLRGLMVEEPSQPGYYSQTTVTFRDGKYRASDSNVIAAMKKHMNFGGTYAKSFSDLPANGRSALFYAGNLPDELQKQERLEAEQLTRDKDQYEDPFRITR